MKYVGHTTDVQEAIVVCQKRKLTVDIIIFHCVITRVTLLVCRDGIGAHIILKPPNSQVLLPCSRTTTLKLSVAMLIIA